MSQFEGSTHRMRCSDCTKFSNKRCAVKDCKVSPKKRRFCKLYEFKGEYENRITPEKIRIPYIDPKTLKLMKKLVQAGITLPGVDGSPAKTFPMPVSTATTGLVAPIEKKETPLIWTPGSDNE